jgi:transposase-like protein
MTCYQEIACPNCQSKNIKTVGLSANGVQRYRCNNPACPTQSFMLEYRYRAYAPGVKTQLLDMAINGSGIRDTARVLGIDKNTVISTIKKNGCSRPSQPHTVRVDAGWWRGSQGASGL